MNKKQVIVAWVVVLLLSGCAIMSSKDNSTKNDLNIVSVSGGEMKEVKKDPWVQLKKRIGAKDDIVERYAESDIVLPASEEEYCGLKGNALVMITAASEHRNELPLAKAYFQTVDGHEVVLTKLVLSSEINKFSGDAITKSGLANGKKDIFMNLSFWLIPIHLLLDDKGVLGIDFKENRKSFSVCRGPWLMDERNREYIKKQLQGIIKIAERLDSDILEKFLEREFINRETIMGARL